MEDSFNYIISATCHDQDASKGFDRDCWWKTFDFFDRFPFYDLPEAKGTNQVIGRVFDEQNDDRTVRKMECRFKHRLKSMGKLKTSWMRSSISSLELFGGLVAVRSRQATCLLPESTELKYVPVSICFSSISSVYT